VSKSFIAAPLPGERKTRGGIQHQPEAAKGFGRSSTSAIGSIVALFLKNAIGFAEVASSGLIAQQGILHRSRNGR